MKIWAYMKSSGDKIALASEARRTKDTLANEISVVPVELLASP